MHPSRDAETLEFYAASAEVYAGSGPGGVNRHLNGFLQRLPAGARILELGCGGGRDAEAMLAAGFAVEPTDGTPEIAARAEARLNRPVRVMRFDELQAEGAYDAVWASASLLQVPRPELPDILARIRRALKPGGLHFASYKGGGSAGRDRHGRYYNYPSREDISRFYAASGAWQALSVVEHMGGGYDPGVQGPWIALTLHRPG
ncbi:class I SAM-dependent methyltransferase [Acidimangrovimonas pyrenivorans]|uniref:Class I SAM-dependent methyltransferase n=1 Tax=Acidimangrovimonas pyrenivorans TaxID=2030798 RepID=A0ABV7AMZ1_9RHOB